MGDISEPDVGDTKRGEEEVGALDTDIRGIMSGWLNLRPAVCDHKSETTSNCTNIQQLGPLRLN